VAVNQLLKDTGAATLILSSRTRRSLTPQTAALVTVVDARPYHEFLECETPSRWTKLNIDENDRNVLILHSSGTTGLPKPIRLAHRYLLGYAACHAFENNEDADWRNLSTLPLYHGFGLLAPCLSLSLGMTCCFPPSNTIPAAESSLRLLKLFQAESLMTVPSILEDIVSLEGEQLQTAMTSLGSLRFVAVGGGPIKQQVGEVLASNKVKLLNHYGATEIGAIASIFSPTKDYDWRYLRLRKDLKLQLQPCQEDGDPKFYKLTGFPCGWNRPFEIQDELELRPQSKHLEVRIMRRSDDLIVLKTGEKVAPALLEEALSKDPLVRTAVCIGNGFFELVLLVEQSRSLELGPNAFVDHVWKLVNDINPMLDQHARISSKAAIIPKPPTKEIRRSDKGSVMRKEVHADFESEIQQAYEALESSATSWILQPDNLESQFMDLVKSLLKHSGRANDTLDCRDDIFEAGLDSLGAVRLTRAINAAVRKTSPMTRATIKPDLVYRNPTFQLLADAVRPLLMGVDEPPARDQGREVQMTSMLTSFLDETAGDGAVVLLTGSTGSLGVHVLQQLAMSSRVHRVVCLNRVAHRNGTKVSHSVRQAEANEAAGIFVPVHVWEKVEFLDANMQAPDLGLGKQNFGRLVTCVTHIVHLAWPMDFKRSLKSFQPHIQGTKVLADLAIAAYKASGCSVRPRLLFASSIAVLARYETKKDILVPEVAIDNPLATAPMGYAEAKWVCEQLLNCMERQNRDKFDPIIVRIGQLSGAEGAGLWKVEEHFPALVKMSQRVSALPALKGVSTTCSSFYFC
jgi:acyl-CoA synthetase (AMP-forming)/AMP-acid ligase II/nucleoside-diphosphate-sugar epimerase